MGELNVIKGIQTLLHVTFLFNSPEILTISTRTIKNLTSKQKLSIIRISWNNLDKSTTVRWEWNSYSTSPAESSKNIQTQQFRSASSEQKQQCIRIVKCSKIGEIGTRYSMHHLLFHFPRSFSFHIHLSRWFLIAGEKLEEIESRRRRKALGVGNVSLDWIQWGFFNQSNRTAKLFYLKLKNQMLFEETVILDFEGILL